MKAKNSSREEKTVSHEEKRASRRDFNKSIAVALFAAPLNAASAQAQTPKPKEATAPPTPTQQATPQPSPIAAAYAEVARARFGAHIKADQWEQVRKDLEGNVRSAERLRNAKLNNGDEPDFVFTA